MTNEPVTPRSSSHPDPLTALLPERAAFLAFAERRLRSRDEAEEVVQEAFAKAIEHGPSLRSSETVRGWFYGILRNAIVDRRRRAEVAARACERLAAEAPEPRAAEEPPMACSCIGKEIAELHAGYRDAFTSVVVDEVPLATFATREGLSNNLAAVRVHRARKALAKRVHATCGQCAGEGCRDCTCAR